MGHVFQACNGLYGKTLLVLQARLDFPRYFGAGREDERLCRVIPRLDLRGCNIRKCSSACGDLDLGPRAPQRPLHQQSVVETFLRLWRRIANPHHLSSFLLHGFAAAALLVGRCNAVTREFSRMGPWFARSGAIMHDVGSQHANMRVFRRRSKDGQARGFFMPH